MVRPNGDWSLSLSRTRLLSVCDYRKVRLSQSVTSDRVPLAGRSSSLNGLLRPQLLKQVVAVNCSKKLDETIYTTHQQEHETIHNKYGRWGEERK